MKTLEYVIQERDGVLALAKSRNYRLTKWDRRNLARQYREFDWAVKYLETAPREAFVAKMKDQVQAKIKHRKRSAEAQHADIDDLALRKKLITKEMNRQGIKLLMAQWHTLNFLLN